MIGSCFLISALIDTIMERTDANIGRNELLTDPKSKEAYRSMNRFSYSVQKSSDGLMQHRSLHHTRFCIELMVVLVALGIILPRIPFDAIVWFTCLFVLTIPGIYHSWIASPSAPPDDVYPAEQASGVPPPEERKKIPRYYAATTPANAFPANRP